MKKICFLYSALLGLFLSLYSCQLTEELDDYEPLYALDADSAITTEEAAEFALVGVYAGFRQKSTASATPQMFLIPDILSGYATAGAFVASRPEEQGWILNNPLETAATQTQNIYTGLYDLINRANWLVNAVENLDSNIFESPTRRAEIIAEGKILRALGHFYLLRNFGEFYNITSPYGINLRPEPVRSGEAFPRNTVAETYASILSDLDQGIAAAPQLRAKNYTNATFAKALKARVLLYMGEFGGAADMAREVIDNSSSSFMLEPTYGEIFDQHDSPALFESSEILFGTSGNTGAGIGIGNFYSGYSATITQNYLDAVSGTLNVNGLEIDIDGTQRAEAILFPNPAFGGFYATKYTTYFTVGSYEMIYHMRMAEAYLILAEADARANNMVTSDALQALNVIRLRAGASSTPEAGFSVYPSTIGLDQFLTAVRLEKLSELFAEGGETWYDLVRYDFIDGFGSGFEVSDIKATATDPNKFILPIPTETIDAGGNVIQQNPGYN